MTFPALSHLISFKNRASEIDTRKYTQTEIFTIFRCCAIRVVHPARGEAWKQLVNAQYTLALINALRQPPVIRFDTLDTRRHLEFISYWKIVSKYTERATARVRNRRVALRSSARWLSVSQAKSIGAHLTNENKTNLKRNCYFAYREIILQCVNG